MPCRSQPPMTHNYTNTHNFSHNIIPDTNRNNRPTNSSADSANADNFASANKQQNYNKNCTNIMNSGCGPATGDFSHDLMPSLGSSSCPQPLRRRCLCSSSKGNDTEGPSLHHRKRSRNSGDDDTNDQNTCRSCGYSYGCRSGGVETVLHTIKGLEMDGGVASSPSQSSPTAASSPPFASAAATNAAAHSSNGGGGPRLLHVPPNGCYDYYEPPLHRYRTEQAKLDTLGEGEEGDEAGPLLFGGDHQQDARGRTVSSQASSPSSSVGYRTASNSVSPQSAHTRQQRNTSNHLNGATHLHNNNEKMMVRSAHKAGDVRVWELEEGDEGEEDTDNINNAERSRGDFANPSAEIADPMSDKGSHAAVTEVIKSLIANRPISDDGKLLKRLLSLQAASGGHSFSSQQAATPPPLLLTWSGQPSREPLGHKRSVRWEDSNDDSAFVSGAGRFASMTSPSFSFPEALHVDDDACSHLIDELSSLRVHEDGGIDLKRRRAE